MLLLLTLSSGFAQFARHMCDDSGVLIATESCSESDKCCGNDSEESNDHCSTRYVYFITAKFKEALGKVNVKVPSFDTFLSNADLNITLVARTGPIPETKFECKRSQSHLDGSFSGVFLI